MNALLDTSTRDTAQPLASPRPENSTPVPAPPARRGDDPPRTFRQTLCEEIECMAIFVMSEGNDLPMALVRRLEAMDRLHTLGMPDLIRLHAALSGACPAKPRIICAMLQARAQSGALHVFGPTPTVRGITLASLLFIVVFFAISLSGHINPETVNGSIYDLEGGALALKLALVTSAAGLGASFAVLFDIWDDLSAKRFDPLSESANWMRLGLGIVAGLVLAELVRPMSRAASDEILTAADLPLFTDPLLALVGGFSATVLHLILTAIVDAFRRAFSVHNAASGRRGMPAEVYGEEGNSAVGEIGAAAPSPPDPGPRGAGGG